METLVQDLRYAARSLRKSPGFTLVAVLTLALGIGANVTLFSVIDYALLRPVPYPEPSRLLWMSERGQTLPDMSVAYPNFVDWREQSREVFTHMAAFRSDDFNLTGSGTPERVQGGRISVDMMPMLGVRPELGRTFQPEEDKPKAAPATLLTHALWVRRFSADPTIVGKSVQLNGESYTVVGVLPADFRFVRNVDLYVPLGLMGEKYSGRGSHPGLRVIGRLKPGATLAQAKALLDTIAVRLEQQYPTTNTGNRLNVTMLEEHETEEVRPALLVLWGAVAFVLLIAIANVANLLMARATSRQQEIAVRVALGAGRGRLVRQLLTESVLLALLGGVGGALLALWGVDALRSLIPEDLPQLGELQINAVALAFTVGLSVVTGLAFGAFPALQASSPHLHDFLKDTRASADPKRQRLRNGLVVVEVALSLVLLVGAGLMLRSFDKLLQLNPGFDPENVLTAEITLPFRRYDTGEKVNRFQRELREKLRAIPGVKAAAVSLTLPMARTNESAFSVDGRPEPRPGEHPMAVTYAVTPGYLEVMKIPLLRGRFYTEDDHGKDSPIVIDETFARQMFPGEDPIGKRLGSMDPKDPRREIVGVVGHVNQYGLEAAPRVQIAFYNAYPALANEAPQWMGHFTALVRTAVPPRQLEAAVRRAVLEVDPDQPVYNVRPMAEYVGESIAARRFSLVLLGIFAALALVLAAVGIYGVMSYSVVQRTREIGIRMALGARQESVLWLVVGQGARLALLGVGLGLVAALGASRALTSLVYGLSATDPLTYALVAVGLGGIAVLAAYLPARRAMAVDPVVSLRAE